MANLEKLVEELSLRMERLEQQFAASAISAESGIATGARTQKRMSPKEFLLNHKPESDVMATFLLGYYSEYIRGAESFTVSELQSLFQEARTQLPGNLNDKINQNIAKGLLMLASEKKDGKKAWQVTAKGESLMAERDKKE